MQAIRVIFISFTAVMLAVAQTQVSFPPIIVDDASPAIFPAGWRSPPINATAGLLPVAEQQSCKALVTRALAKYPSAVVNTHLKQVYVLGRLEYSGVSTGGTNSRTVVYVVKNERISPAQMESIFHAEFSSILLRNCPQNLDQAAWQKVNPPAFSYRGSGVQAIKNKQASQHLQTSLHAEGFINEYAKASIEEDFNSYAARLLSGDAGLWRAIETYPKVRAKADLVAAFYAKLDSSLTKEWFLKLRQPLTR